MKLSHVDEEQVSVLIVIGSGRSCILDWDVPEVGRSQAVP